MNPEPIKPCRLDERTARVLGLPPRAVTPTARFWSIGPSGYGADPTEGSAVRQWPGQPGRFQDEDA